MIGRWIFLRDSRLSRRTWLTLAGVALLALVLFLPLRLALAWSRVPGLTASTAGGSVWNGWIGDLQLGSLPLGTVEAGLRPLPLLIGRREFAIERRGPAGEPELSALAAGGSGWFALRRVNGQVALGEGFAALPAASLGFHQFRMESAGGRCRSAAGQVSLILSPLSELMPGPLALSGQARCAAGALYVPMTGPSGMERMFLRIEPDGRWRADLVLAGLPVEISAPLLDMGFSARPGGIGISANGRM